MHYSLLAVLDYIEPKNLNEEYLEEQLDFVLFDYFEEKYDYYIIGGYWEGKLILKDSSKVSFARIKDIDFSKMSNFNTEAVYNGEWHERDWSEEDSQYIKNYYEKFIKGLSPETVLIIVDCHL